jgi:dihydrofolate reductase
MTVSLIVAYGKNREIGHENKLLWHIREDLLNFKKLTMGGHMIMGRKTYESIGRPLPGRTTVIITRNEKYDAPEGVILASSLAKALEVSNNSESKIFICGGGEIYKQALANRVVDKLHITEVDYEGDADTFFPELISETWEEVESIVHPKTNDQLQWIYKVLTKKN